ncbi:hypothetical protein Vafri_6193 [Volvox africanus]|uniref:Fatty acid desaturase domain-containing protein n=1 Tax=Volvox africanus TaxID=51714 RepID=A0A8J4EZ76_9CHLO|nr:hypothetical protein Vafri_6193 [Volvox africanus]
MDVQQRLCNNLHRRAVCGLQRYAIPRNSRVFSGRCRAVSNLSGSSSKSAPTSSLTQHGLFQWSVPFILPIAAAAATAAYGGSIAFGTHIAWLRPVLVGSGPLLLHFILPFLDLHLGQQHPQPLAPTAKVSPADDLTARVVPTIVVIMHLTIMATAYATIATAPLQPLLLPLLAYSLATSASCTMAASHELVHSRNPVHLSAAALFLTLYWWYPYYRAHHQHHLHVCTPVDYTCAPKGLNIYSYFPPYITSSYAEAWQLAIQECYRAGKPRFSRHNTTLVALVAQALLAAVIYAIFGPVATAVHFTSNIVFLVYMATLDYILHYGLVRPLMAGNERRYTPITPHTSWNSLYAFENGIFFNVLYHSDHHLYGVKSYGYLRPPIDGPLVPFPINLLGILVLVPPLWRYVMDRRADEANAKHLEYLGNTAASATPTDSSPTGAAATAAAGLEAEAKESA